MRRAKWILKKLLYPPAWARIVLPGLSFAALAAVFIKQSTEHAAAPLIYSLSAYSLTIWLAAVPGLTKRVKSAMMDSKLLARAAESPFAGRYFGDLAFRGSVGIYQGAAVNFFYAVFRVAAAIRYASVWFFSMAVYYLVLGGLRVYLILAWRRRSPVREQRCYRTTAWMLFLLNVPMGGMIILMVRTNSGVFYPRYMIYLSAFYTFYAMAISVINLGKFRKLDSPILSAAKVLNFISAMTLILGLQTAMISRFSRHGENYRRMMNAITGSVVYSIVILMALFMLFHSKYARKKAERVEPIGK